MTTANIYLTFDGNCEQAFNFYKSVLHGEFQSLMRFSEMPPQEGMPPLPKEEQNKIMHISLPLSGQSVLMGSDTAGPWASGYKAGNNFSVSLSTDSKEEADRLMAGLSEGGRIEMPMDDTFWGSYFGMCVDQFGINWMISFDTTP